MQKAPSFARLCPLLHGIQHDVNLGIRSTLGGQTAGLGRVSESSLKTWQDLATSASTQEASTRNATCACLTSVVFLDNTSPIQSFSKGLHIQIFRGNNILQIQLGPSSKGQIFRCHISTPRAQGLPLLKLGNEPMSSTKRSGLSHFITHICYK